jgi:hypothetical protein
MSSRPERRAVEGPAVSLHPPSSLALPATNRKVKSKGAPDLAFETWDSGTPVPACRGPIPHMETPPSSDRSSGHKGPWCFAALRS